MMNDVMGSGLLALGLGLVWLCGFLVGKMVSDSDRYIQTTPVFSEILKSLPAAFVHDPQTVARTIEQQRDTAWKAETERLARKNMRIVK